MKKKELLIGLAFAIAVTLVVNYTSIERIVDLNIGDRPFRSLCFSITWYAVVSYIIYLYYIYSFKLCSNKIKNRYLSFIVIVVGALLLIHGIDELHLIVRDLFELTKSTNDPMKGGKLFALDNHPRYSKFFIREKGLALSKHIIILVLNGLFVYILKLLYINQAMKFKNEQLRVEKIKAEHSALLQQINPHFFFNSLNGLRFLIMKQETEEATSYLNNLTTVFRQIFKHNEKNSYTLKEEVDFVKSYVYMLEKRYEAKFAVHFDIAHAHEECLVPRFSILTLIENIVKHNKISSATPIEVKIYTVDTGELVVENNIVPLFEPVESNGIGLENLNKQYELLINKKIVVQNNAMRFTVKLPLIQTK